MQIGTGKYTYELVTGWAKLPEGWSLPDVAGIVIDSKDRIFVLNRSEHPIIILDRDGNLLTTWGEGVFKRPHNASIVSDNYIYCADDGQHTVSKFTVQGKRLLMLGNKDQPSDSGFVPLPGISMSHCIHSIKRGAPPFNFPTGVDVSSSGEIFVSDGYGNARVHKFSPDGTLLQSWGEPGTAPGQFRIPHALRLDSKGRVWVVDRENNRIQIFNQQGKLLDIWTDVSRPADISFDKDGTVYVAELNQRVSIFSNEGKLLSRLGSEGPYDKQEPLFIAPHAAAVDSHGDLYVGEVSMSFARVNRGLKTIQKLVRKS